MFHLDLDAVHESCKALHAGLNDKDKAKGYYQTLELSGRRDELKRKQTFFMYGKDELTYHIDYVFLPRAWQTRVRSVKVESGQPWRGLSDHAALTVDVSDA